MVAEPVRHDADDATVAIDPIGSYETGVFDESAAEIVQAHGDRLFVVNAQAGAVEVLDYTDPAAISHEFTLSSVGVANSVAIRSDGLGIIAVEAPDKTAPGTSSSSTQPPRTPSPPTSARSPSARSPTWSRSLPMAPTRS